MDCGHVIRQQAGVAQAVQRPLVDAADRHDHAMAQVAVRDTREPVQGEAARHTLVVAMDAIEDGHQHGRQDQHDPRALPELVTANTTATVAVATDPMPFTAMRSLQLGSNRNTDPGSVTSSPGFRCPIFHHRRAIPAWLRVKDRNTPMAYKGISRVTLAWKRTMRTQAMIARLMIPFEYTSRLPGTLIALEESVAGVERPKPGEVREGSVGCHDQDDGGRPNRSKVDQAPAAGHGPGQLRDHGLLFRENGANVPERNDMPRKRIARIPAIHMRVMPALRLRGS